MQLVHQAPTVGLHIETVHLVDKYFYILLSHKLRNVGLLRPLLLSFRKHSKPLC